MRLKSPSTARNWQPILQVLQNHTTQHDSVLEIACGSGEHGYYLADKLTINAWYPSDIDDNALQSALAWREEALNAGNMKPQKAQKLDVSNANWPDKISRSPDHIITLITCINMIHISPFETTVGLFEGAEKLLPDNGELFLYGPYKRKGEIAPSNAAFDQSLKSRNEAWGVRDLDLEIMPLAAANNFELQTIVEMPANNLSVVFRKVAR